MLIFRSLAEIPPGFGPCVVSVGNFDGVHRGHRWVLEQVKERARTLAARSIAVTFDPHPTCILRPERAPRLITPLEARLELLAATEIDAVLVIPFTQELSSMSAVEFAQSVLCEKLAAVEVHEGSNFRFGHRAQAGVDELRELGRSLGFQVRVYEALHRRGMVISSSTVRSLIAAGDVRQARSLLGHPFFVRSTPARGRGIGGKLLVPTVNLAEYNELLPAFGVYITCLRIQDRLFEAVTNVGNRPTFGPDSFAVESHILNFQPVALDETTPLELSFFDRLREEKQWPSPDALRAQIMRDVAQAQRYFRLANQYRRNHSRAL
ncbi:MAG TPA: bifunctional riboflavin kinase/FAD synthetase [Acidisarcina sp.]|nr:bifunctional riboflavin kinase/FAD synthetase [Acidisarcina sp.]